MSGNVFDETELAKHVEEALKLDAEAGYEEIRAAAAIVLLFCHNYVWPVEEIGRHVAMAIARLEELSRLEEVQQAPGTLEQIQTEIAVLRARVESPNEFAHPKWWQF